MLYIVHNSLYLENVLKSIIPLKGASPFACNYVCMTRIRCQNGILYLGWNDIVSRIFSFPKAGDIFQLSQLQTLLQPCTDNL